MKLIKKLILVSLTPFVINGTAQAYDALLAPPSVEYPTKLIGQFMSFCIKTMNARASMDSSNQYVSQQQLNHTHSNVCSCIMDSYRYHNNQEVFDREFVGKTSADVPNFVQYLSQCSEINNNRAILRWGS